MSVRVWLKTKLKTNEIRIVPMLVEIGAAGAVG
jgi:hypothetical protein